MFNCAFCQSSSIISSSTASYEKYIHDNEERHIQELTEFISIPSISSLPAHKEDVQRAAEWLKHKLQAIGMSRVEVLATEGNPVVFAEWNKAKGKPTVLVYGHYDVQPVQEAEWTNAPFQPKVENGRIYGRGSADNKGGLMTAVWAAEALLKNDGKLPVNLKFLFEGDEERGSPYLKQFAQGNTALLKTDFAYNADAFSQFNDTTPAIKLSYRGAVALQFTVKTANKDVHSGLYGGKTYNAAVALSQIITSFHTPDGKVAVEGFYDKVLPLSQEERSAIAKVPYDEKKDQSNIGTTVDVGEKEFTPLERVWLRPTLEITGIWGGYTAEEGFLAIIPGSAHARIMCRTVANQEGTELISLIKKHIESHKPEGVTIMYKDIPGAPKPVKFPINTQAFKYDYEVLKTLYGKEPLLVGIGGTVGALSILNEALGAPAYSFGFGPQDANVHSANESTRLSDLEKGQVAYCMLFQHIGKQKTK